MQKADSHMGNQPFVFVSFVFLLCLSFYVFIRLVDTHNKQLAEPDSDCSDSGSAADSEDYSDLP